MRGCSPSDTATLIPESIRFPSVARLFWRWQAAHLFACAQQELCLPTGRWCVLVLRAGSTGLEGVAVAGKDSGGDSAAESNRVNGLAFGETTEDGELR